MRGIPSERVPEAPSHSARSPARRAWLPASASAASPASPDTLRGPCWSRQLCSSRLLEQDHVNDLVDHREHEDYKRSDARVCERVKQVADHGNLLSWNES